MKENNTQINQLTNLIKQFCEERDWDQFHNPKDLAIGLVTESAELLDIFRFKSEEQIKKLFETRRDEIEEEVADIFYFLLRFVQMNDIHLENALKRKMEINNQKYPVDKVKGKNHKYSEY